MGNLKTQGNYLKMPFIFILTISISLSKSSAILNKDPYSYSSSDFSCSNDHDCNYDSTLLFCISNRCQCLNGGVTYLNGYVHEYNMEWSVLQGKCVSKVGSPCTLKDPQRYSYGDVRLDCNVDTVCTPRHIYGGSGNQNHGQNQRQYPYPILDPGSSSSSASSSSGGQGGDFGICVSKAYETNFGGGHGHGHNFVPQGGNRFPVSPTELKGSMASRVMWKNGGGCVYLFGMMMILLRWIH